MQVKARTAHALVVAAGADGHLIDAVAGELGCSVTHVGDPVTALSAAMGRPADLVVAALPMPGADSLAFVDQLRRLEPYREVPLVMICGSEEGDLHRHALERGATDVLRTPFGVAEARARLGNLLRLRRGPRLWAAGSGSPAADSVRAGAATREEEIIMRLCEAAEAREADGSQHILRMASYCRLIGEGLGLPEPDLDLLFLAAPMHDIGKIAVSDAILLKPGKLTAEERSLMELHTLHGFQMLAGSGLQLLRHAADIAATHHERWDGTGYPARLKGLEIPLFGRIAAVADVFDALTSDRPYKDAWSPEDAMAYVTACAGQHFDPDCVRAFAARWESVCQIYRVYNQGAKTAGHSRGQAFDPHDLAACAI